MPPIQSPEAATSLALARARAMAGRLDEASAAARQAAALDPNATEAFAIWGVAEAELGRFGEAVEPLVVATDRAPEGSVGWANLASQLARCLASTGLWGEATERAEAVARLQPPDPLVRYRIGAALARMNLTQRALPHLEWARTQRPDWADLQSETGLALMSEGRLEEAEAAFEAAIRVAPLSIQAHTGLAQARRWTAERNHVDRLRAAMADPSLKPAERGSLGYALFKELDDLGLVDEAWPALVAANEARRAPATQDWSADRDAELTAALIEAFPPERLGAPAAGEATGEAPIFIVGLPRSGTTLLERMLAAHSQVRAMGELPTFPLLFRRASDEADRRSLTPQVAHSAARADLAQLGELYLGEVGRLGGVQATYFIDKLPANSLLVGAIRLALPGAKIIQVRRTPMDVLFGAYKVSFSNWYGWSCDLDDLAEHYVQHERLAAHWRDNLPPESLIEVAYEDLVADPEGEIRRVLQACGLGFEPACLRPHEAPGSVRTASITQVRDPISTAKVGAWRRYERHLEPLRQALLARGVAVD